MLIELNLYILQQTIQQAITYVVYDFYILHKNLIIILFCCFFDWCDLDKIINILQAKLCLLKYIYSPGIFI